MDKHNYTDRLLSAVLTITTVIAAGFLIEARFKSSGEQERREFVPDWQDVKPHVAVPLGEGDRSIAVAVFTDFECPYCARLDSVLRTFGQENPNVVLTRLLTVRSLGAGAEWPVVGSNHSSAASSRFR